MLFRKERVTAFDSPTLLAQPVTARRWQALPPGIRERPRERFLKGAPLDVSMRTAKSDICEVSCGFVLGLHLFTRRVSTRRQSKILAEIDSLVVLDEK